MTRICAIFVSEIFSPRGRIGRVTWLIRIHALFAVWLSSYYPIYAHWSYRWAIYVPVFVILLVAFWIQTIRRLHDIEWSGRLILLNLIPYVGSLFLLLVSLLVPGTKGPNRYGDRLSAIGWSTKIGLGIVALLWAAFVYLVVRNASG